MKVSLQPHRSTKTQKLFLDRQLDTCSSTSPDKPNSLYHLAKSITIKFIPCRLKNNQIYSFLFTYELIITETTKSYQITLFLRSNVEIGFHSYALFAKLYKDRKNIVHNLICLKGWISIFRAHALKDATLIQWKSLLFTHYILRHNSITAFCHFAISNLSLNVGKSEICVMKCGLFVIVFSVFSEVVRASFFCFYKFEVANAICSPLDVKIHGQPWIPVTKSIGRGVLFEVFEMVTSYLI